MDTNTNETGVPLREMPTDLIATLRFLNTDEGGRSHPAHSGYRPHFKLPNNDLITSCHQVFLDKEKVYPGESSTSKMTLLGVAAFQHELASGDAFTLNEGNRIIAEGMIQEILNPRLRKESAPISNGDTTRYLFFKEQRSTPTPADRSLGDKVRKAVANIISVFFPKANAGFGHLYGNVVSWKIAFDLSNNWTDREIGYDRSGQAIVAAPFKEDLGLWADHELSLEDYERFKPTVITKEEFEEDWLKFNSRWQTP